LLCQICLAATVDVIEKVLKYQTLALILQNYIKGARFISMKGQVVAITNVLI